MVETVMPGFTSAPGVHGPRQFAAYLVVGVIDHCVPIGGVAVLRKRLYVW